MSWPLPNRDDPVGPSRDRAIYAHRVPAPFRSALDAVQPYVPGRPIEVVKRELGIVGEVIKLASNEGPFPPVPAALEAIAQAASESNRYPDGSCHQLRHALAARHGVDPDQIVVGNGADAVLDYLAQALYEPGDEVAYCWPSFPVYPINATKMGAVCVAAPLAGSSYDLEALSAVITPKTKAVYVTNPNNPTGGMVTRDALLRFLDGLPSTVLPVIDEAYFEFIDDPDYPDSSAWVREGRRLVAIRTFSKIYGMAGLRVGYGVMPADVAVACGKVKGAFDVSQLAQVAALASLDPSVAPEIARRRAVVAEGRTQLVNGLRAQGLGPWPTVANFVFVPVGDGVGVAQALERRGVIVRATAGFGDPTAIRITVGTPEENARFLSTLAEIRG